jgi:hypothetical protein
MKREINNALIGTIVCLKVLRISVVFNTSISVATTACPPNMTVATTTFDPTLKQVSSRVRKCARVERFCTPVASLFRKICLLAIGDDMGA